MGRSLKVVLLKQTNMKLLLVLAAAGLSCAAPEAAPEADPAFAYSIGGYQPLVYTHHLPTVAYHHPVTYTLPTVAYGYPYGGLLPIAAPAAEAAEEPAVEEARKKREADPAVIGAYSTIKNPSPTIYHNVPAFPALSYYTHYAHPLTYGGLVYGRKKREAEAEAEAEADPWLTYGYGYHPYAYSAYYHPYAYAHLGGCRNYLGGLVPCAGR